MKKWRNNPEKLLEVLNMQETQTELLELVNEVLKINFIEIKVKPEIQKIKYPITSDPTFYLIELEGILPSSTKVDLALRFLAKDKLKENSFLYWTYIFSKELEKYNSDKVFDEIVLTNHLEMEQMNIEKFHDGMYIGIENEEGGILHHGVELHFVCFEKYITTKTDFNFWKQFEMHFQDDFLLLAIKLEEEIFEVNQSY